MEPTLNGTSASTARQRIHAIPHRIFSTRSGAVYYVQSFFGRSSIFESHAMPTRLLLMGFDSCCRCVRECRYPSTATHCQRRYSDLGNVLWKCFPVHRVALPLWCRTERPGPNISSEIFEEGCPLLLHRYHCCLLFAHLMSLGTSANQVFISSQDLVTIAQCFTWCSVCLSYIGFHKALKAQGVDRSTLVFKSPFQPYTA